MRRLLILLASVLCLTSYAQDARKVLDATAAKVKKSGDIEVSFVATSFEGTTEQSRTQGTMRLKGKKMQMETPEMHTWYDGTTMWSYMPQSGEVNVTTPTDKEIASIHPYSFINAYKKGYRLSIKDGSLRGEATYVVHMQARYAGYIAQEVYLDIRKSDYTPLCVRVMQDGNWSRVSIHQFKSGLKLSDDTFRFDPAKHPDVEVIDLR